MANIILIHGYPLDASAFAEVTPHLDRDHTVLVPDLLGFGSSEWPAGGDLSMEAQAGHVLALMDAEDIDEAVVVGLSMGGYVALALASMAPHRVQALGLVGSKPEADSPEARTGRDRQAELVVAEGREVLVAPMTSALVADDASLMTKARLRTMVERTALETYVSALVGMRDRPDRSDALASFEGPVAILVGSQDPLVPVARAHEIAALAIDGTIAVVDGAGHLVPMEKPSAVVAFVTELVSRL